MAHFERSEFADKITVLEQDVEQLRVGLQAVLTGVGLAVAMTLTTVVLAVLHPLLLLLPLAAVPPLLAGRWAERMVNRAREASAESTRRAVGLFRLSTDAAAGKETADLRPDRRGAAAAPRALERHPPVVAGPTGGEPAADDRAAGLRRRVHRGGPGDPARRHHRPAQRRRRRAGVALATQVNQQVATAVALLSDLQRMRARCVARRGARAGRRPHLPPPVDAVPPARPHERHPLEAVDFVYPLARTPRCSATST